MSFADRHIRAGARGERLGERIYDRANHDARFQAILARSNGGGVSGRTAPDDGYVVDCFWQGRPL